ncbi:hypothetical protein [Ruania halotolerans]|uniref:hypothetical protein n=1 Tax=Ruania halotolerans TaxID=2897773 RepID=UPI001E446DE1|nr:hypothetical protein [Ruania halotolerans]UFU07059.1 hypothetical protein LQF10_02800 [Ruania halotolerans]
MRSRQRAAAVLGRAWRSATATRGRQVATGVLVGLLLAPIGIAAVGGFATADEIEPEGLAAGQMMDLGQVEVRVEHFFVSDRVYTSGLPEGASAWFGLVAEVVNPRPEEVVMHRDLFRVPAANPLQDEPSTTLIASDAGILVMLEPDLPQRVVTLWPLTDPAPLGDEITVEAYPVAATDSLFFPGDILWSTQPLQAVVTVPLGEVPADLLEEEQ